MHTVVADGIMVALVVAANVYSSIHRNQWQWLFYPNAIAFMLVVNDLMLWFFNR